MTVRNVLRRVRRRTVFLKRAKKLSKEPKYRADVEYFEECVYLVIVDMLERFPRLKKSIKDYLDTFPR